MIEIMRQSMEQIRKIEKMLLIKRYAVLGEKHDVMEALELLTKAYIDTCGISLGLRTLYYSAAEAWQEKLAWMDLPLSEMARKEPIFKLMPHITSAYNPEKFDKYDIAAMENDELLDSSIQHIGECPESENEPLKEVLCWGILKCINSKDKKLEQFIETTAPDGKQLTGILTIQKCWSTWVTMASPYDGVSFFKYELVRDAKSLLIAGYEECQRLHALEKEIRELYPIYQEEYNKIKDKRLSVKYNLFYRIYGKILSDTVISLPDRLFEKWFGLKFYNIVSLEE